MCIATQYGKAWKDQFFSWPDSRNELLSYVKHHMDSGATHIYATPAMFGKASRLAENFRQSAVTWADYDNGLQEKIEPDYVVMTSPGKFHAYWKLDAPERDADKLESINRSHKGHDTGTHDVSRVLRIPGTINGKHGLVSRTIQLGGLHYTPREVQDLFYRDSIPEDRSGALWRLGRTMAEAGIEREEAERWVREADKHWEKFVGRPDCDERIAELLDRCYSGLGRRMGAESSIPILGFRDFLGYDEGNIEWVLDGFLYRGALGALIGPSASGKTQLLIRFAEALTRKQQFLIWPFVAGKREKILFLSYEMNRAEIMSFLDTMEDLKEHADLLQEYFDIYAPGYSHDWADLDVQNALREAVQQGGYTGIMVDSFGSTTPGSLKDDGDIKRLLDFADKLRNEFGVWILIIHHIGKEFPSKADMRDLDKSYGNSYFGNRIRLSMMIRPRSESEPELLQVSVPKLTLAKKPDPFWVKRTEYLNFELVEAPVVASSEEVPGEKYTRQAKKLLTQIVWDEEDGDGI